MRILRFISFICCIICVQSHCKHIRLRGLGKTTIYTYKNTNDGIDVYTSNDKLLTHQKCLWRSTDLNKPYNTYTNRDCDVGVDTGFSDVWVYESGDINTYTYLSASLDCRDNELLAVQSEFFVTLGILFILFWVIICCSFCNHKNEVQEDRHSEYSVSNSCMPTPLPTPRPSSTPVVSEVV